MQRCILLLILLAFSCSKDKEVTENNPLTAVRLIPGTGETGGCSGVLAYSGYQDYICIDWEDENEFAEKYIIYYSDAEDGEYSEIASTTEKSYQIRGLQYGQPYFFYVVPFNSTFGNGPQSEVYKTYISQKTNTDEFLEISDGRITSFDVSSTKIYVLTSLGIEKVLEIFDLTTGAAISTFTNMAFNTSNRILVNSNEDIYLVGNLGKSISKFDIASNQVINQLTSEVIIDNVDINKSENQIYLTKEDGTEIEVYGANFEPEFQVPLSQGYQEIRKFIVGDNGNIYVSVAKEGTNSSVLEVITKEGTVLNSITSNPWSINEYPIIDSSGSLYAAFYSGLNDEVFLYRYQLANDIWEFYTNYGDLPLSDSVFEIDAEGNVYRARTDIGITIERIVTTD